MEDAMTPDTDKPEVEEVEIGIDGMTDREMLEDALAKLSCLTAEMVRIGYGRKALKKILEGK